MKRDGAMKGDVTTRPLAFIGLGNMGGHMSRRLAQAGLDLTVFDLDAGKVAAAVAAGARPASSAAAAATDAAVLLTSLPTPAAVDDVMLGAGGVLAALPDGALWVDMSTSLPAVADRVRTRGAARGIRVLDAPVSGMSTGAATGTLHLYVGGEAADLEQVRPVLEVIGDRDHIRHVGGHGAGYTVKLLLNLLWFSSLVATAEALTVGVRAGVDLAVLHEALVTSQANSVLLEHDLLPLLLEGDYEPGFAVALACKDLGLAIDLARSQDVPVELSAVVEQVFRRARAAYGETAGEMSPVRLYEELAGLELRLPGSRPAAGGGAAAPGNDAAAGDDATAPGSDAAAGDGAAVPTPSARRAA